MISDAPTPESDAMFYMNGYPLEPAAERARPLCEKLEHERDELIHAVYVLKEAKGRYHTQLACEKLFSLLP